MLYNGIKLLLLITRYNTKSTQYAIQHGWWI